jgi:predicted dehydrogenase
MKRRQFVTAGVGLAATLPAAVQAAGHAKERIPIGFLGATYSHGPAKIQLAMTSPDWEFVGVCDASPSGRRTCAELGAKIVSEDELFRRSRVMAVESAVRDHAADALRALKAGKHVHLEKPPAMRLADMQAVVAEARDRKLMLQTGFMWRYHPGFRAVFEAIRRGWLGEVFMVRGFIGNNLTAARRPEWTEYAGGGMFELASHLIDAVVRLLGKPKNVTSILCHHGPFADRLMDNNVAVLEYELAIAVLVNTALQPADTPQRSFEVLGTGGTATLAPLEPPGMTIDLARPAGPYRKGLQRVALPAYKRYEADFAELAAAVRGEQRLSVSLDEELLVAETVLRASGMA